MRETSFWRRYRRILGTDLKTETQDELETHIALHVEDLMRRGRTEAEARTRARLRGSAHRLGAGIAAFLMFSPALPRFVRWCYVRHRLDDRGWVVAELGPERDNRRAKYYCLTRAAGGSWWRG